MGARQPNPAGRKPPALPLLLSLLQSSIDFLEGTLPPHLETPPLAEKGMVLPSTPGQKYTVMVRPAPRK